MDKCEERKVIEMVFGGHPELNIVESERPDFICEIPEKIRFGVEVTDFFLSESEARLCRIPNYAIDLLTTKKYKHKDDKHRIRVDKVIYHSAKTGERREIEAIIGEEHTIDVVVSRIKTAIENKTAKSAKYSTEIVDLIVRDLDSRSRFDEIEMLIRAIHRTDAIQPILNTRFREIYLVTTNNDESVCVPLRANLFIGEVLAYQKLFKEHHGTNIGSFTIGDFMVEMARYLTSKFGTIEYEVTNNKPMLFYSSVGVGYGDRQELEIVDVSIESMANREVADFDDEGDVSLSEFVNSQMDSVFARAPILFPAKKSQSE
jgi:hypothetical protein